MANVLTRRASSGYGLVCGIGIYEPRVLCMTGSPELRRAYRAWNEMLRRAAPAYAAKRPTYAGTSVDPAFHHFADFAVWAMKQVGWGQEGFQLDKDILRKGARCYSPDTCVFVPLAINSLLVTRSNRRGELPIGVTKGRNGRGFVARCRIDGVKTCLGVFDDPSTAFAAYKAGKEANIRRMAEQYRSQIDPRAYTALMAYQVEITD